MPLLEAHLAQALNEKPGLTHFLPARVEWHGPTPEVKALPWQGSGDIATMAKANCFLVVPPDREQIDVGETSVLLRKDDRDFRPCSLSALRCALASATSVLIPAVFLQYLVMAKLSHYGKKGEVRMVDVSAKSVTTRTAIAHAFINMKPPVVAPSAA